MKGNERLSYAEWRDRCRDRSDPLNHGLVFSLPMFEGSGSASVIDASRPHHPVTVTSAPVWYQLPSGQWVMSFDGNDDSLECPTAASVDLDVTAGDFSICLWAKAVDFRNAYIFTRGRFNQFGWELATRIDGSIRVYTNQSGKAQYTSSKAPILSLDDWVFIGFSRSGHSITIFRDGEDWVAGAASHSDPLSNTSYPLRIASNNESSVNWFKGMVALPRIWARSLSAAEHRMMFERERGLFGV